MFFRDPRNPSMNELANWFQINFTQLANDMKESTHAAESHEPNPYHIEDSIWTHTMMVCMQAESDNANKINLICALLHDTGKPEAREVIAFDKPKPVHTETNQRREDDKEFSKTVGVVRDTKTHFRGHEGISVYKSMDVLKALKEEGVLFDDEISEILTIISHHGTLFDNIKDGAEHKPESIAQKWKGDPYVFKNFVKQVKYDSLGRFFTSKDGRKSDAYFLGDTIFGDAFVKPLLDEHHQTRVLPERNITLLVGVPLVGKSTWIEANVKDEVVISRDDTLMKFGQLKYGTEMCPKCNGHKDVGCDCHSGKVKLNYTKIWRLFAKNTEEVEAENTRRKNQWVWDVMMVNVNTPEPTYDTDDQAQIDRMLRSQFEVAVCSGQDIIIDMTNTSKKSRRKWLGYQVQHDDKAYRTKFNESFKLYGKRAVVFGVGYEEIRYRNKVRTEETGKHIPMNVIHNMMKAFMVPLYDEVSRVTWVM